MRSKRPAIKDNPREVALFQRRAITGFAIIVLLLGVLGGRFFYLQVVRHEEFVTRADQNRIKLRPIAPARGLIFDRNGVLLADNTAAFRLEVIPERVKNLDATLEALGEVVPLTPEDIKRFKDHRRGRRGFQSLPLRFRLSDDEVARFAVNRWRFPGVEVVPYLTRTYPRGAEFGHLVGYVARIDEDDLARLDARADGADLQARYAGTTHMGRTGIERYYEDLLHGEPGYEKVETNADGRALRVLDRVPPKPGKNLYLSIDVRLQEAAEAVFEGKPGSAVAIDPRNGEVLAMVSVPSYDPNLFVNGISHTDYRLLTSSPLRPLLHRALVGTYKPGSTVKPFMGVAGLELGIRSPQDTVYSTGEFHIPGQQRGYRDWRKGGHGHVDLVESLAQSVNTYFYSLALDMGIDRLSAYLGRFGFGKPSGIDLIGEGSGILPSREWKRAMFDKPWFPGETVIAGIGQGFWVVTPVQLANATAILAARGARHPIHLLRATQDGFNAPIVMAPLPPPEPSFIVNMTHWDAVRDGMVAVVSGPTGTAKRVFADAPYSAAGKTGTAQRFSRTGDEVDTRGLDEAQRHQALFVAFAPVEEPQIALALVLEFGASGSADAAPPARQILDAWLNPPPERSDDRTAGQSTGRPGAPACTPAAPGPAPAAGPDAGRHDWPGHALQRR
ncbi:penicillin-binding protein 2 [Tahibacter amnicola]|uniref:Peptidoglycan D,D-transpeptidase MrdA n=1 Tax=Tahibacter amnicola TaxID=2976241 RepID=A0ABY6BEN6_9GAMM|nr:penicillin-binding protein 2 [Tahibacter amnicola]UXI68002.1 penicillin-binding protein 2 [Tahibacter amnicola]